MKSKIYYSPLTLSFEKLGNFINITNLPWILFIVPIGFLFGVALFIRLIQELGLIKFQYKESQNQKITKTIYQPRQHVHFHVKKPIYIEVKHYKYCHIYSDGNCNCKPKLYLHHIPKHFERSNP